MHASQNESKEMYTRFRVCLTNMYSVVLSHTMSLLIHAKYTLRYNNVDIYEGNPLPFWYVGVWAILSGISDAEIWYAGCNLLRKIDSVAMNWKV